MSGTAGTDRNRCEVPLQKGKKKKRVEEMPYSNEKVGVSRSSRGSWPPGIFGLRAHGGGEKTRESRSPITGVINRKSLATGKKVQERGCEGLFRWMETRSREGK